MFCTKCGANNEETNEYCISCGAKLIKPVSNNTGSQGVATKAGAAQAAKPVNVMLIAGLAAAAIVMVMVVGVRMIVGKGSSNKPLFEQIEIGKTTAADVEKYFDKNNLGCNRDAEDSIYSADDVFFAMGHNFILQFDNLLEWYNKSDKAFINETALRSDLDDTLWGVDCEYFISVSGDADDKDKKRDVLYASCYVSFENKTEKRDFMQQLNSYIKNHQKTDMKNLKFYDNFELNLTYYPLETTTWNGEKLLTCLCVNELEYEQEGVNELGLTLYAEPYFTDKELKQFFKERVVEMHTDEECIQKHPTEVIEFAYSYNENPCVFAPYKLLTLRDRYDELYEEEHKEIAKEISDFTYSFILFSSDEYTGSKGIVIESCNQSVTGDIVIPETIQGHSVIKIANDAFADCTGITSIKIPDCVTSIKDYAFSGCSNLKSIKIPDSVTDIGSNAFSGCSSLTGIDIPEGITAIKNNTFSGCSSLTDVKIPSSVTTIDSKAFNNCSSLVNINIDNNITIIADSAFDGCDILVSVELNVRFPNAVPKPAWLEAYREFMKDDFDSILICLMDFKHVGVPYLVIEMIDAIRIYYYNGTKVELELESYGLSYQYSPNSNKIVVYNGSITGGWSERALISMDTFQEELYCYIEAPGTGQYGHDWDNATYKDRTGVISEEEYDRIFNEIEKQMNDSYSLTSYKSLDDAYQAYLSNRDSISASGSASAISSVSAQASESVSEYILKDSGSRYLTKADLQGLSADDCRIARNEIYARHGRKFDDDGLQSHFNACSWYQGTIEPSDFQETMLSDIEVANKNLIVEYEKEMGYR